MALDAVSTIRRGATRDVVLLGIAALALLLGLSVYLFDRDWSSAMFLAPAAAWQGGRSGIYGALGGQLPSFLHACGFALLTIIALRPMPRARAAGAAGWCALALALECLQAGGVRTLVSDSGILAADWPAARQFHAYIAFGHFDFGDLWATVLGCLTAYAVATIVEVQS